MRGTESIVVDYTLDEPPAEIWRLLTEPKLVAQWLMENDLRAEVGHRFNFRAKPMGDWDGVVHCEVLEVDPPKKLAYTWRGGARADGTPGYRLDTVVTWTLTPTSAGGTELHLVHDGFLPDDSSFQILGQGWRRMVSAEKVTRILAGTLVR